MKTVGLQADYEVHHMDHLGVVCMIMDVPVLFSDEESYRLAKRFYPWLKAQLVPWRELAPDRLVENYDVLFYTNFCCRETYKDQFVPYEEKFNKKLRMVCCPHGNSDKGHSSRYMELFADEDITLVYGERMFDFFREKQVVLKQAVRTGNYRLAFYEKHKTFFDALFEKEVMSRFADPQRKLLLFAPTWEDGENGTSFFEACSYLLDAIPSDYNVLVKCHPRIERRSLVELYRVLYRYEERKDVVILSNYPHVYPLLQAADLFLGEMSSVGYDYLYYNRPMFFINHRKWDLDAMPSLHLWTCGDIITPADYPNLWEKIEDLLPAHKKRFEKRRGELYQHTFGLPTNLDTLKQEIFGAYDPKYRLSYI